jgi:hypothetical protein
MPTIARNEVFKLQRHHALRPLVRIRTAKKGAPTNAVTLPMGRTAPNKAFESTDVAERISAPASIAPGKKKR